MARTKVSEWSAVASNNTDINGIDIAEGCAPSGINNAIREAMKQIKDWQSGADGEPITAPNGVVGNVTGNVTGNLTGNSAGTHTGASIGTHTGAVIGNVTGNLLSVSETVTAGNFIVGNTYTIASVGTTNFTLIGASANTVGVRFTATGVGSGTGTATTFTGNAVRSANLLGGTGIPYNSGTDITTFLPAGTAGQVLQSNGASAPSWVNGLSLSSVTGAGNQSLTANGHQTLFGGLIVQWGSASITQNSSATVTFPKAFPTACFQVFTTALINDDINDAENMYVKAKSLTNAIVYNALNSTATAQWFAIGY